MARDREKLLKEERKKREAKEKEELKKEEQIYSDNAKIDDAIMNDSEENVLNFSDVNVKDERARDKKERKMTFNNNIKMSEAGNSKNQVLEKTARFLMLDKVMNLQGSKNNTATAKEVSESAVDDFDMDVNLPVLDSAQVLTQLDINPTLFDESQTFNLMRAAISHDDRIQIDKLANPNLDGHKIDALISASLEGMNIDLMIDNNLSLECIKLLTKAQQEINRGIQNYDLSKLYNENITPEQISQSLNEQREDIIQQQDKDFLQNEGPSLTQKINTLTYIDKSLEHYDLDAPANDDIAI